MMCAYAQGCPSIGCSQIHTLCSHTLLPNYLAKDLRLALELAGALEQLAPMAAAAAPLYSRVATGKQLHATSPPDFSAIYRLFYGGRDAA